MLIIIAGMQLYIAAQKNCKSDLVIENESIKRAVEISMNDYEKFVAVFPEPRAAPGLFHTTEGQLCQTADRKKEFHMTAKGTAEQERISVNQNSRSRTDSYQ